jgi:hypothetical protein
MPADEPFDPQLVGFGYAPGGYLLRCIDCTEEEHAALPKRTAAKGAYRCFSHANAAMLATNLKGEGLGKTGEFPHGKLHKDDEVALNTAIGVYEGKVIVNFGTNVIWIGMQPQGAADFATTILAKAREAAKEQGIVLRVVL